MTHPTVKPTPRQPKTFDTVSLRAAASTRANLSLQDPIPRVQSEAAPPKRGRTCVAKQGRVEMSKRRVRGLLGEGFAEVARAVWLRGRRRRQEWLREAWRCVCVASDRVNGSGGVGGQLKGVRGVMEAWRFVA